MSYSKKRAAVVVPTAFLVALSGMVAAPAMADEGTSPQAVIDGPNGEYTSRTTYDAPRGQYTIALEKVDRTALANGIYWVQLTSRVAATGVSTVTYQQFKVNDVSPAETKKLTVALDARTANSGDSFAYSLKLVDKELASFDQDPDAADAEFTGVPTAIDGVTITIENAVPVSTTLTSAKNFEQGVPGTVTYLNLVSGKTYVSATGARVIETDIVGGVKSTTTFTPTAGEAGAMAIRLYQIDMTSAGWVAAAAADTAEGGHVHRMAYLNARPGAVANVHNINVVSFGPQVKVTDNHTTNGSTATDSRAVAGSTVTLSYTGLPAVATGTTYRLVKSVNGVEVPGWTPNWTTPIAQNPANSGLWAGTATDTITAAESGRNVVYTLTNQNGTSLATTVSVDRPTAALANPGVVPVMEGDTEAAGVEFSGTSGNRYVVVTTVTPYGQGAQYVVSAMGTAANADLVTDGPGTLSYQVYYVPAGLAMDPAAPAADQRQWLLTNAVAQLAQPFEVTVHAEDARATVDPQFDATLTDDLEFTFENLDELELPASSAYYVIVNKTAKDGTRTQYLANTATSHTVSALAGGVITLTIDETILGEGETYTASLYVGEANAVANYSTDAERLAAAMRRGVVKANNGTELTATSREKTVAVDEPEEPGAGEQFFFQAPNAPEAFSLIPAGTPASEVFVGDWDGDGVATPGYRQGNRFFLASDNSANATFTETAYGQAGDVVYIGDWDGNGTDTPSVRRGNQFHLKNDFSGGDADIRTDYGRATDEVIVGDWDGNGTTTPSVRRGNEFHLKNDFTGGPADLRTDYGRADDQVVVGDWDGNGTTTPGVRRGTTFLLKNDFTGGGADLTFTFGELGDKVIVGKFVQSDSKETVGVYRPTAL